MASARKHLQEDGLLTNLTTPLVASTNVCGTPYRGHDLGPDDDPHAPGRCTPSPCSAPGILCPDCEIVHVYAWSCGIHVTCDGSQGHALAILGPCVTVNCWKDIVKSGENK